MPEETAKAFILHPDGKIWFHTGDIGVMWVLSCEALIITVWSPES